MKLCIGVLISELCITQFFFSNDNKLEQYILLAYIGDIVTAPGSALHRVTKCSVEVPNLTGHHVSPVPG